MIKYKYTLENQTIETIDLNSIPSGLSYETIEFELPSNAINPIDAEALMYEKRQKDGLAAINRLMSELRLNALANNYPRIINQTIENAFSEVTKNILLGWWVTAKEKCELVEVGGYVSQALKDRIYNTITNYISENY